MEIKQCILTNSSCYRENRRITPSYIIVHSTGANNKTLRRYVQPDDGILGRNNNNNDWNRPGIDACVHAFIGVDKNGTVRCYQTLPWNYRPWGCGAGSKGSHNNDAIQFEICEDALTDKTYFTNAFNTAIELCKYLMKQYNIPSSHVISHHEACLAGLASNHADCDHWLKKFGKDMNWFRSQLTGTSKVTTTTATKTNTTKKDSAKVTFIKAVQKACGAKVDGIAGSETLSKTVTVSYYKNDTHAVVKPIQTYLNTLGYNCGTADGEFGSKTKAAVIKYQKANGCVADGEITAKCKTWKKLLGMA